MSYGTSIPRLAPWTPLPETSRRHDVSSLESVSPIRGSWPMRIGILTGGGDCPGLNAVIRSVVRTATTHYGSEVVGFRDGWRGLLEDRTTPLDVSAVDGLLTRGGTPPGPARPGPAERDSRPGPKKRGPAPHGR